MRKLKLGILLTTLLAAMIFTGCEQMVYDDASGQFKPKSEVKQRPTRRDTRDEEPHYATEESITGDKDIGGRGATDAAMEWADKYAKTAQELLYANKRLAEMENDKKKMQSQIAKLRAELNGYKRELADANAMLKDMKRDLKEWRDNVLGYRKQIMASQAAQLAALHKILELLGGEVPSKTK